MKKLISLILLVSASAQISSAENKPMAITITNVVKVFPHGPGKYSIRYQEGSELKNRSLQYGYNFLDLNLGQNNYASVKSIIIMDVKEGEPMWVHARVTKNNNSFLGALDQVEVVIHIHSPKDIDGGGCEKKRSNGKNGSGHASGITQVIE